MSYLKVRQSNRRGQVHFKRQRLTKDLAMALHVASGTHPLCDPHLSVVEKKLSYKWHIFETNMDALLGEYSIKDVVDVEWFKKEPRKLWGQPKSI